MAEILDVIQRFTYQVEDAELQQAAQVLQQQLTLIGNMAQRVQNLQNTFDKTAASEIDKRTRIAGLIQRQKALIDQTTQSMGKQVQENGKLQQALTKEIGLINTLDAKLKLLREDRAKAFDAKEIAAFNRQIEAIQGRITQLTTTAKSNGGGLFSTILQGVGIGTGIGLVTQGVGLLKDFVTESSQLAAETEGVARAFDRLNAPELLDNLRTATKGTVSDLELMKQAVQFNNFGLPVEKLGIALEFARQRAADTGQSIDYLVQSIVTGIGRQSPLILDNLGINAKRVADRFKETGNFAEAAFAIIQEESAKSGKSLDTFSEKQARMNANIQNFKSRIGGYINAVIGEYALGAERAFAIIEALNNRFTSVGQKAQAAGAASVNNPFRPTFNSFIRPDLSGMSREELEQLRGQGEDALNPLASGDTAAINRVNQRLQLIDEALNRFKINTVKKVKEAKKEVTKNSIKPKDILELSPEDQEQELNELDAFITRIESKIAERKAQMAKNQDALGQTGTSTYSPTGTNPDDIIFTGDELISSRNDAERTNTKREENKKKQKDNLAKRKEAITDAYNEVVDVATTSFQMIYEARLRFLDLEIEAQRDRVNQARLLAEKGNGEIYEIEAERLRKLQDEREKQAQRQLQINAVLQASNSAVAVTEAIGAVVGAAAKGDPYTIAARVAAAVAALVGGIVAIRTAFGSQSQGFKDGVVDLQGEGTGKSDSIPARLSRGESVITAEATQKNKAVLMAMNNGAVFTMPNTYTTTTTYSNNTDMSGVVGGLKRLEAVIADTKLKQDIFFNEYGVGVLTSRAIKRNKKMNS